MIEKFTYKEDERWTYEVDMDSSMPFLAVEHPEFGAKGATLRSSPALSLAKFLAAELVQEHQSKSRDE